MRWEGTLVPDATVGGGGGSGGGDGGALFSIGLGKSRFTYVSPDLSLAHLDLLYYEDRLDVRDQPKKVSSSLGAAGRDKHQAGASDPGPRARSTTAAGRAPPAAREARVHSRSCSGGWGSRGCRCG